MQREIYSFICPHCAGSRLNMLDFESLMVLRPDLGMFTIKCPSCLQKTSMLRPIPQCMSAEIEKAAEETGAGMGNKRAQG